MSPSRYQRVSQGAERLTREPSAFDQRRQKRLNAKDAEEKKKVVRAGVAGGLAQSTKAGWAGRAVYVDGWRVEGRAGWA